MLSHTDSRAHQAWCTAEEAFISSRLGRVIEQLWYSQAATVQLIAVPSTALASNCLRSMPSPLVASLNFELKFSASGVELFWRYNATPDKVKQFQSAGIELKTIEASRQSNLSCEFWYS